MIGRPGRKPGAGAETCGQLPSPRRTVTRFTLGSREAQGQFEKCLWGHRRGLRFGPRDAFRYLRPDDSKLIAWMRKPAIANDAGHRLPASLCQASRLVSG